MTASLRLPGPLRLLLLAACAAPLAAFPGGAPTEACLRGMVPNHSNLRSQDIARMPFIVTRQTTADGVRVTIASLPDGPKFRGFMVMARDKRGDPRTPWAKNKGSWRSVTGVNPLNECSSVTHADRAEKTSVTITWKGDPSVDMYATIVQDYQTFWADMPVPEATSQQRPQQRPAPLAPQHAVVTSRPFARPEFAPVVDQSHFNIQEFFRQ